MALLFISSADDAAAWTHHLKRHLPALEVRVWPELGDPAEIDAALAWDPAPGVLAGLPRLRLVSGLGMGVDRILSDPTLPPELPVARLVDPDLVEQLGEYVCHAVLHWHRQMDAYREQQARGEWQRLRPVRAARRPVGLLGLGASGAHVARCLGLLGFPVLAWTRGRRERPGVRCFHGDEGLAAMLPQARVLVCLLPLTAQTEGIVDARTLGLLPRGAYLINCARGRHVVDGDLLAALESGQVAGAALDVFAKEPLPAGHAYWRHPRVRLTPHAAGLTRPSTGAAVVAENLRRLWEGRPLLHLVDRRAGY